jgi:hypothetical protein
MNFMLRVLFPQIMKSPGTHWMGGLTGHRVSLDMDSKRKIAPVPGR